MSIQKHFTVLCASMLFSLFAGASGCEKEEPACDDNETQQCACPDSKQGVQTCTDGEWGACDCGGGSGSASDGSSASASASDGSSASASASASDGSSASGSASASASDSGTTTAGTSDSGTTGNMGPAVGSPCGSNGDCGAGQICVIQNPDDIQGICTIVCSDWTDCTSDKIGQSFWECCDLSNGSFACAPDTWECGN